MERQLSAVLVQLTSSPDALAASESVLSPLEENPSYAVSLVQTLETHADAKNYCREKWATSSQSKESREVSHTQTVKEGLLRTAKKGDKYSVRFAVRTSQALALAAIIEAEAPAVPTYLAALIDMRASGSVVVSQLEAISVILTETKEKTSKLVGALLPAVLSFYTTQAAGNLAFRKLAIAVVFKALDSLSWADGMEQDLVRNALASWQSWHPLLLRNLEAPETPCDLRSALKVLTVFFRDYPSFSKDFLQVSVRPIWILMYSILPHFYQQALVSRTTEEPDCSSEDEEEETSSGMHGIAVLLLDLLSSLTLRPMVRQAISQELTPIIRTLANYVLLTADQTALRDSDPAQYLLDEDLEVGVRTARTCALKLISELVEVFREEAVWGVIAVAEMLAKESFTRSALGVTQRVATNQQEIEDFVGRINSKLNEIVSKCPQAHGWKSREAAVTLIGKTANDILSLNIQAVKKGESGVALEPILEAVCVPLLGHEGKRTREMTILTGRTLWCIARLSEIVSVESPVYLRLLDMCANSTSDRHSLPVKFTACFAISKLGKHPTQPFLERLPAVMRNMFEMTRFTSDDTLHLILETIRDLSSLSEETTSVVAQQYSATLLQLFKDHFRDAMLGADIVAVLRLWADIPLAAGSISKVFLSYFGELLREEKSTSTDSPLPVALDMLQMLLLKLRSETESSVLDLLPALLRVLNTTQDVPILLHGTNCLRSFIANFSAAILDRGYADYVLETVGHLLNPTLNETAAPHLGYCMVQVFDKISPKVDEDLVLGCVTKLYKSKMPSIVQGLVLVCARLIHMNPHALISFLLGMTVERRVGLKVLLDKWLIHQPLIRGKYTKNATVSALARLFSLKDKRLEALLVIGFNPSHSNLSAEVPAPLKILSTLIRCLDNEAAPRKAKPSQSIGLNEEFNTVVEAGGLGVGGHIDFEEDSGERVDTIEDEGSEKAEESKGESSDDAMAGLKKQLLSEVEEDFESTFQVQEKKKGLGDYETGSECLMSDMLDFDYDDGDELGEDFYEDDLYSLGDWYGALNLQNFLLEFFSRLIENDKDYLKSCFKHMLAEDVALFKKHFTLV